MEKIPAEFCRDHQHQIRRRPPSWRLSVQVYERYSERADISEEPSRLLGRRCSALCARPDLPRCEVCSRPQQRIEDRITSVLRLGPMPQRSDAPGCVCVLCDQRVPLQPDCARPPPAADTRGGCEERERTLRGSGRNLQRSTTRGLHRAEGTRQKMRRLGASSASTSDHRRWPGGSLPSVHSLRAYSSIGVSLLGIA